jgi:hypothetical protein
MVGSVSIDKIMLAFSVKSGGLISQSRARETLIFQNLLRVRSLTEDL